MATEQAAGPSVKQLVLDAHTALEAGDKPRALALFRQAAQRDPYNERLWMAMLPAIEEPEDRRVCLENVIAINPKNTQARRLLRAYYDEQYTAKEQAEKAKALRQVQRRLNRRTFWRGVVMGILIALFALFLGVIVSVIVFGVLPA